MAKVLNVSANKIFIRTKRCGKSNIVCYYHARNIDEMLIFSVIIWYWNKYPCRLIKHNIIIKVKKKKKYIYTARNTTY